MLALATAGLPEWLRDILAMTERVGDFLATHPIEAAVVFIPLGLAFLLYGFKVYKWLVIVTYALFGAVAGGAAAACLAFSIPAGVLIGGLVLGLLAWPLHRMGLAMLGGFVFALIFVVVAAMIGLMAPAYLWIIGGLAFVAGVVLTLIFLRPLIIVITSIFGASLLVEGALRLTLVRPSFGEPIVEFLNAKPYLLAVTVLGVAIVGAVLQWREAPAAKGKSARKKKEGGEEEK